LNESGTAARRQAINFTNNAKGVTLIELIAVLVILGVMASVVVKKFDFLVSMAGDRALQEVIKELNVRETTLWTKLKWSSAGWTDDASLFAMMDTNMGSNYVWTAGPDGAGGTIKFKFNSIVPTRTPSTSISMGSWN
jgi:prepilin-type N-terminal cleavage/methylation domain-containing protein